MAARTFHGLVIIYCLGAEELGDAIFRAGFCLVQSVRIHAVRDIGRRRRRGHFNWWLGGRQRLLLGCLFRLLVRLLLHPCEAGRKTASSLAEPSQLARGELEWPA